MTKSTQLKVLKIAFKDTQTIDQISNDIMGIGDEQISALMSTIEANPDMLADPEIKAIYDNYNAGTGQQNQQFQQQQTPEPKPKPQNQQQPQNQQVHHSQISEEDFISGNQSLFGTTDTVVPNFEKASLETLPVAVKAVFGIDTTKDGWIKDFLSSAFEQKTKSEKAKEIEAKLNSLETELSMLPTPLFSAMQVALKAGDWREELNNIDVDFTKSFDELPITEQVRITNRLIPDVPVTIENKDDAMFKQVLNLGKVKYQTQQESIRREAQLQLDKANQARQKYQVSVERELAELKASLPEEYPTDDSLSDIKDALTNKKIFNLFYEQDGTLKKGAAKAYAFAKYGERVYNLAKSSSNRKAANEEAAKFVGSQQTRGGGGNSNNVTQTENEQVSTGLSMFNSYKQTY